MDDILPGNEEAIQEWREGILPDVTNSLLEYTGDIIRAAWVKVISIINILYKHKAVRNIPCLQKRRIEDTPNYPEESGDDSNEDTDSDDEGKVAENAPVLDWEDIPGGHPSETYSTHRPR